MFTLRSCCVALCVLTGLSAPAEAADLWSPNPAVAVFEGPDYSGRAEANCAIRIVAARNGAFSGQVVVFGKEETSGPEATVSDLRLAGGKAVIPADAVRVRYALPTGTERGRRFGGIRNPKRFDALVDTSRPKGRVHPVWVTVHVPADAAPGDYEGTLAVAGRRVPVRVHVSDWALPSPVDYATHVGLIQSPETVALKYAVPMWSEKHLALVAKSFDLLGTIGNKPLYVPLICRTHFGNSETMVRWVRDGDETKYDYAPFEKYLDVCIEHMGKPKIVCFYVWEPFTGGGYFGRKGRTPKPPSVSRLDPQTGAVEPMTAPVHGTPESAAFWKPVFDGLRERLKKRGIGDDAFMIGIAGDSRPSKEIVKMFHDIAPYARWVVHSHGKTGALHGVRVGYLAHVWGVGDAPDPEREPRRGRKRRYYGWKNGFLRTVFPRYGGGGFVITPPLWMTAPLGVHRAMGEITLAANLRGFGRVGADFWGVLETKDRRGRPRAASLINRYPETRWSQLSVTTASGSVLYPGPEGALSTVRFEMLREGVQEAEAKIFIERALDDAAKKAKLGDALATKAQALLDRRVHLLVWAKRRPPRAKKGEPKPPVPKDIGWEWFVTESGWQDRSQQLFETASAVSAALGG